MFSHTASPFNFDLDNMLFDSNIKSKFPEDLIGAIDRLRRKKNAVILAHYYQTGDLQDIADFVGDSLQLAQAAKKTNASIIAFAGVHFMAETAKILNPTKKVVVPDLNAGCSLADTCPAEDFKTFLAQHPDHLVISYINCSAEVKALSDILCTSSNAEKIVLSVPQDKKIIFAPDKHLGTYLRKKTGRPMLLWDGACIVHEAFDLKKILQMRVRYPNAKVIAHPECTDAVLEQADFIGSTSALLSYVGKSSANQFIVVTEPGIIHQMKKLSPEKAYYLVPSEAGCACNECPYMKLNTMEKLYWALELETPEIVMPQELCQKALLPLERMLELSA